MQTNIVSLLVHKLSSLFLEGKTSRIVFNRHSYLSQNIEGVNSFKETALPPVRKLSAK